MPESQVMGAIVMVKGTVTNTTGNETGVTINGIVATVYGNQFVANQISLVEGSNTITVTATDTAGNTAITAITRRMWIMPPTLYPMNPMAQKTINITAMV